MKAEQATMTQGTQSGLTPLFDEAELATQFHLSERAFRDLRAEVGCGFKAGRKWLFEKADVQAIILHLRRKTQEALKAEEPGLIDPAGKAASRSTRRGRSSRQKTGTSGVPTLGW